MTLTYEEANSRIDELRHLSCRIQSTNTGEWWLARNNGTTNEHEDAHIYTVVDAIGTGDRRINVEIINPPPATAVTGETKPPPILLTRQQCLEHMDVLKLKQCYMFYNSSGEYWKSPPGSGTTALLENRARVTVNQAVSLISTGTVIELIDQELAAEIFNSVLVVQILGQHLVDLLKLTPLNPTARAKVMAVMGQMPPTEADTWDKLQDWVKETHKLKAASTPAAPQKKPEFTIALQFRDVETGGCHYSVTRNGESNESVSLQDIARIIEEKDCDGVDRLVSELVEYVKEDVETPDMDWGDDCEYDDHDANDTTDFDVSCRHSRDRIAAQLTQYLQANAPAETLRRLGL